MIKHRLLTFLSIMAVALFTTACFDESGLEIVYDGPSVLEWDMASTGSTGTYLAGGGQAPTETITVNLVGPQRDQPTQVQWRVNQEASTAIEGVHYNIVSDQNITIPANSNSADVEIEVLTDNFASPEERVTLVLELVGGDLPVAANYGTVSHRMSITCPSEIPLGTWRETTSGEEVTLTSLGDGNYKFSNFNIAYYAASNNPIGAQFSDVCNELTLYGDSEHGVQWRGNGVYDEETQTITFPEGVEDVAFNAGAFSRAYEFEFVGE